MRLSLKHFILKQRALTLYRTAIRASRGDPSPSSFTRSQLPIPSHPRPRRPKRNNLLDQSRVRKEQAHRRLGLSTFSQLPTLFSFHSQDLIEAKLRASRRELERVLPYRYPPR